MKLDTYAKSILYYKQLQANSNKINENFKWGLPKEPHKHYDFLSLSLNLIFYNCHLKKVLLKNDTKNKPFIRTFFLMKKSTQSIYILF